MTQFVNFYFINLSLKFFIFIFVVFSYLDFYRYNSDRESRGYGNRRNYDDSEYSKPKTRTKLILKPRTVPIEENVSKEG